MPFYKFSRNPESTRFKGFKGLLNKLSGKDKKNDNDDGPIPGIHYRKEYRHVSDDERAAAPDLGEHGWGNQSWSNVRRDQKTERFRQQQGRCQNSVSGESKSSHGRNILEAVTAGGGAGGGTASHPAGYTEMGKAERSGSVGC